MAAEILIPKLGMTMEEGMVADWLVPDGGEVGVGQPVYRLETEKIEMEVEAEVAGTLRQVVPKGAKLPPGSVVAYVLAAGESLPEGAAVAPAVVAAATNAHPLPAATPVLARLDGNRIPASPIARRLANEAGLDLATIAGTGPGGRVVEADVLVARERPAVSAATAATAVAASPIARRLAAELGLDLARVPGTGPGGRITKEDVETAATIPSQAPPTAKASPGAGESIPVRAMRRTIARRMHASLQEMAQLTMGMDVTMDEAIRLREQLVAEWQAEGVRPTYTDLVVRAVARALRAHPRLNASMTDDEILLAPEVNLGLAVALDDGLVVPVIRNADHLSVHDIAVESSRLAEAARTGSLGPDDFAGATFSITSLGTSGVHIFTPIINPPNVAILGIGTIRDDVAWDGETPRRTRRMTLSLTIDHRAVDGAPGAAFLGAVRDLLEAPYRLLI
jgi:pyruvate dehydrogenase E2 component (dihydrolipoamide acetyltransferase)